jgi:SPP1 family predicted phage head-tail adaptor
MIHRLTLQARDDQTNSANESVPDPTFRDITKCYAEITPTSGKEYQEANAQNALITHVIKIFNIKNKTDAIASNDRFYYERYGTIFNIVTFQKQMFQRDRIITCQCIEDESRDREEEE